MTAPIVALRSHDAEHADLDYTMTDHLGWVAHGGGRLRAFAVEGDAPSFVHVRACGCLDHSGSLPDYDVFTYSPDPTTVTPRAWSNFAALRHLGCVGRFRNPCLWDSIATAITRQVVRATQARDMYGRFCRQFGTEVVTPGDIASGRTATTDTVSSVRCGPLSHVPASRAVPDALWLFPGPDIVLELSDDDFVSSGMAFKRRALRAAATAYQQQRGSWGSLPAGELATVLQQVPYIGPWTAAAAVADYSNDWSLYAYGDLAVRTWANRAFPNVDWAPDETGFAEQWERLHGAELASVTLLTLAWGDQHVRSNGAHTSGGKRPGTPT